MSALKKERSCGVECCENATELKHLCPDCLSEYHDAMCSLYEPDLIRVVEDEGCEIAERLKFQKYK